MRKAIREGLAVAGGAVVLAFLLALLTADVADEPALAAPVNLEPSNWLGWTGAAISSWSFHWFGLCGSIVLALVAFAAATRPLVVPDRPDAPRFGPGGLVAAIAFVLAVATLERVMVGDPIGEVSPSFPTGRLPGGIWGTFLGGVLLRAADSTLAVGLASVSVLASGLLAVDAVRPNAVAVASTTIYDPDVEGELAEAEAAAVEAAVEAARTPDPLPDPEPDSVLVPAPEPVPFVDLEDPEPDRERAAPIEIVLPSDARAAAKRADEAPVETKAAARPSSGIDEAPASASDAGASVDAAARTERVAEPIPEPVHLGPDRGAASDEEPEPDAVVPELEADEMSEAEVDEMPEPEPVAEEPEPAPAPKTSRRSASVTGKAELILPSAGLLEAAAEDGGPSRSERAMLEARGRRIERTLEQFNIKAEIRQIRRGPNITLYALELGGGVRVRAIENLLPNVAVSLQCPGGIRLQAPIPGTSWIGLEVPNERQDVVRIRELLESEAYREKKMTIPLLLGRDASGNALIADLAKMPHLLIAGTTGSGKSVCVGTIILSILLARSPKDVRLILIDPKQVELAPFRKVPHLMSPVVTEMRRAGAVLDWAVNEMEKRYSILARAGVRQISEYNAQKPERLADRLDVSVDDLDDEAGRNPSHMPWIVVIIDELADLMQVARKEVEVSIQRLAQKSRAVGIHVIVATQRPSVDVITGIIKGNLPARIAFQVASKIDSRTILDQNGAESLLGEGDMLFLPNGSPQPVRAKGTYVSDAEVDGVCAFLAKQARPRFSEELIRWEVKDAKKPGGGGRGRGAAGGDWDDEDDAPDRGGRMAGYGSASREDIDPEPPAARDALYDDAVRVVLAEQRGSVSLLQRKLEIGYGRASRLIDMMSEDGVVGTHKGSKARKVVLTLEQWEARRATSR